MKHLRIRIYGIVQGVGFRPFVSRLAMAARLSGSVCNKGSYVEIEVCGPIDVLAQFQIDLCEQAPERSVILKMDVIELPLTECGEGKEIDMTDDFQIIPSAHMAGDIFVSPDIAVCPKCQQELYDKNNRRYQHPFINCTACGPRLTILKQMPYDRERTTMSEFPMCEACRTEYESPESRRYDAQPVCCPDCGPEVFLLGNESVRGLDAIRHTRDVIRVGGIAAIKGIGGFHLCCDAGNEQAVQLLRERKSRPQKPFAVMAKDLQTVCRICEVSEAEKRLLTGPQKPIVICDRRGTEDIDFHFGEQSEEQCMDSEKRVSVVQKMTVAPSVAPDNPTLGVMLPYAPLQLLLFDLPTDDRQDFPDVLVMTSGNRGGAPICRNDAEVMEQLAGLCDVILTNDRDILIRADDSVVQLTDRNDREAGLQNMIRRSRGYAPLPVNVTTISLSSSDLSDIPVYEECKNRAEILAVGGELKNTFCIGKHDFFYLSPYVGNMSDARSLQALAETSERMLELLETKPQAVACDLHPSYQTAAYAKQLNVPQVISVQHHYAHILSCMAENDRCGESDRVLGIALDGTGYGTDGSIWGGELLLADINGFERVGMLRSFTQIGGDASAKDGWRIALGLLWQIYETQEVSEIAAQLKLCDAQSFHALYQMQKNHFGCVQSTSAGRLFDAVSALLGFCNHSTFEGEAAQQLQYAAEQYLQVMAYDKATDVRIDHSPAKQFTIDVPESLAALILDRRNEKALFELDWRPFIRDLIQKRLKGTDPDELAYHFHAALAQGLVDACVQYRDKYNEACLSDEAGLRTVALSGGCFCNRLLLRLVCNGLTEAGFEVLTHRMVPANDSGIALGQAVYAMHKLG